MLYDDNKVLLTHADIMHLLPELARKIREITPRSPSKTLHIFPVPRGGVPVAYALMSLLPTAVVTADLTLADVIVDDLIDSGKTRRHYIKNTNLPFFTLIGDKTLYYGKWVVFPWERDEAGSDGIEDNIVRMMQYIGEDPNREGLIDTPKRVVKALQHWYSGYSKNPADVMKVFEDGAEGCDEMIVVENIPFFSHCEHHMAPIIGTATVGYVPNGKIIGLSKIPRLLEIYARRMQVQERLTTQVADALMEHLAPLGCGVLIRARHLCMESRGVEKTNCPTTTSALRGVFKDNLNTRNEFMALAGK